MKKIIALIMVVSILFCFTACNNTSMDFIDEPVELDVEMLKENWDKGEITFANGETITLPYARDEFLYASTLVVHNSEDVEFDTVHSGEIVEKHVMDVDTKITVGFMNVTELDINFFDSTAVAITIEDIKEGNRWVKIGGTLTTGVARADVEKALGIPEGSKTGDESYTYVNEKYVREIKYLDPVTKKDVVYKSEQLVLKITFNDKDVVSKVEYKVVME